MLFSSPKNRFSKYLKKYPNTKIIVVAGSYGRTSAINALGNILGQNFTVSVGLNYQEPCDIVILPYDPLSNFSDITPDFTVVTAIHEDAEADKFFALANRSRHVFVNMEDIPKKYSNRINNQNTITYGVDLTGYRGTLVSPDGTTIPDLRIKLLGEHNLRPVVMSIGIAHMFKLPVSKIIDGVNAITPLPGRLNPGLGINGAIIIDDSADTSDLSMELSLRTIYSLPAPSRVFITGRISDHVRINRELISEVLVVSSKPIKSHDPLIKIFSNDLSLLQYLATRLEPDGIVLLEYSLPSIIEKKLL